MIKNTFKVISIFLCIISLFCLSGCTKSQDKNSGSTQSILQSENVTSQETAADADIDGMDFEFTDRDKNHSYDENSAKQIVLSNNITDLPDGVTKDDSAVTITKAGTYLVSGAAENISITVQIPATEKLQIILNGVQITNKNGPAIFIKSAEKVVLTLADGSNNTLSDGESYTLSDDDTTLDAALFSREDLTINGSGTLTVNGNLKHGIVSKDDLIITGGTIDVTSKNVSLNGKDCVKIANADITLNAGTDGIRSDNETETTRGYVYINSGKINITAQNDGIQSVTLTKIEDCTLNIKTGGGSENASTNADGSFNNNWQFAPPGYSQNSSSTQTESAKAVKSQNTVLILGGSINIDSSDDSIHANNTVSISGGVITALSGDDGIHADSTLNISGGEITVLKSYEGIEGSTINISGGNIDITASDDGLNAAGGNDSSALGNRPGMNAFTNSTGSINISGGYILVDASGDGVDSNGTISVSGGVTLVSGPTNSGNGAFDYQTSATVTGGVLIATGSSGMAQGFSSAENQGAIFTSVGSVSGGTNIALCDESGKAVVAFTPKKQYQSVVVTAPDITKGNDYSIVVGGSLIGADENGYGENLQISGGNTVTAISLTSNLYNASSGGFGGGDHGGGAMGPMGRK